MNIDYSLKSMVIPRFTIDHAIFLEGFKKQGFTWQIGTANRCTFMQGEKSLQIGTVLDLYYQEETQRLNFLSIQCVSAFNILNWDELFNDKLPELPEHFISLLLGVIYSSLRGVIIDRTAFLAGGLILPVIDPNTLPREFIASSPPIE